MPELLEPVAKAFWAGRTVAASAALGAIGPQVLAGAREMEMETDNRSRAIWLAQAVGRADLSAARLRHVKDQLRDCYVDFGEGVCSFLEARQQDALKPAITWRYASQKAATTPFSLDQPVLDDDAGQWKVLIKGIPVLPNRSQDSFGEAPDQALDLAVGLIFYLARENNALIMDGAGQAIPCVEDGIRLTRDALYGSTSRSFDFALPDPFQIS